jgi:hypothetical protein
MFFDRGRARLSSPYRLGFESLPFSLPGSLPRGPDGTLSQAVTMRDRPL